MNVNSTIKFGFTTNEETRSSPSTVTKITTLSKIDVLKSYGSVRDILNTLYGWKFLALTFREAIHINNLIKLTTLLVLLSNIETPFYMHRVSCDHIMSFPGDWVWGSVLLEKYLNLNKNHLYIFYIPRSLENYAEKCV